jgi:hypothetical protein
MKQAAVRLKIRRGANGEPLDRNFTRAIRSLARSLARGSQRGKSRAVRRGVAVRTSNIVFSFVAFVKRRTPVFPDNKNALSTVRIVNKLISDMHKQRLVRKSNARMLNECPAK